MRSISKTIWCVLAIWFIAITAWFGVYAIFLTIITGQP